MEDHEPREQSSLNPVAEAMFRELPPPGGAWPQRKRQQWLATMDALFAYLYEDPPTFTAIEPENRPARPVTFPVKRGRRPRTNNPGSLSDTEMRAIRERWITTDLCRTMIAREFHTSVGAVIAVVQGLDRDQRYRGLEPG